MLCLVLPVAPPLSCPVGVLYHTHTQRLLRVERAFPVREAMGGNAENDGINVEMDPEDQFKVRKSEM